MTARAASYTFGPVPSRRLGRSLGINNVPAKACTYSCVYCQVGRTTRMYDDRREFYNPDDILDAVRDRLAQVTESSERVDYLTFVPDGEPTLDIHLGSEIELLKTLGIPIGVITNSSLLWRDDVREELSQADWVSLKTDAFQQVTWRLINRPHKTLQLSFILEGLTAFARAYRGTLVTETMLVKGLNDNDYCMKEVADILHELKPHRAYLSIPTRPPAEKWVTAPDERFLNRAYQILAGKVSVVEFLTEYEGDTFISTGDIEDDLLSIAAVHPLRREAISALLDRAHSTWDVVDRMVNRGDLVKATYNGHDYYLKRFRRESKATR